MEDRFKFRAWEEKTKTMVSWSCMRQTAFNCFNVLERYKNYKNNGEKREDLFCESFLYSVFGNPDLVLMQCTGLKDKNGNLIYEGDMCLFSHWKPKEIVWRDGRYYLGDTLVICCEMECDRMEVIGNKYEGIK